MRLKTMAGGQPLAIIRDRQRQKMKLDIGVFDSSPATDKPAAFKMIARPQTILARKPAQPDSQLGQRPHGGIQRDGLCAGNLKIELQMILKVFANTLPVHQHVNPVFAQFLCRANARELKQLW